MLRVLFGALAMLAVLSGNAHADMIDDVIRLYNPKLVSARAVIECLADGGSAVNCATTELTEGELSTDPDISNIVALIEAVNDNDYPTVVARAGLGIACAWVDFEGKAVVCNDFAAEALQLGIAAAGEAADLGKDVAEAFASLGTSLACTGDILCSSDSASEYDPSVEWDRCFTSRVREGVIARLSASDAWSDLSHNAPSPRAVQINGHSVTVFLFKEGSVAGECFNPRLLAVSQAMLGSSNGQQFAQQTRQAFLPMFERYKTLVEQGAAEFLDDAQSEHHNAQQVWLIAAQTNAAEIFGGVAGNNMPLMQFGAVMARRNACVSALNRPAAQMLAAWADAGHRIASGQQAGPFDAQNWPSNAPQAWCANTFTPALQTALQGRQTAYEQARTEGCLQVARNRLRLSCPAGAAFAHCQTALTGVSNAQCTLSGPSIAPPPVTSPVTPQTYPPSTTTTAPVIRQRTPVLVPAPNPQPATPTPEERPPR